MSTAMILAGGEGSRMMSARPKPLHMMCGRPLLVYVIDALRSVHPDRVVIVVGSGSESVPKKLAEVAPDTRIEFIEQSTPRGSGDAVMSGLTSFLDDGMDQNMLILPCDTPLLRPETVAKLLDHQRTTGAAVSFLTVHAPGATHRRRVIRKKGGVVRRLARPEDLPFGGLTESDPGFEFSDPDEVAVGVFCVRQDLLAPALRRVIPVDAHGEVELADVVEILAEAGHRVETVAVDDPVEVLPVNDRVQLAHAEKELRRRTNDFWLDRGVTMVDPERTYIDTTVRLSTDVTVFPGSILQGDTVVGSGAEIGPNTRLVDCAVGSRSVVTQTTAIEAEIGSDARVGPYAMLEPGRRSHPMPLPVRFITPRLPNHRPVDQQARSPWTTNPHISTEGTCHGAHHQETTALVCRSLQPWSGRGDCRMLGRPAQRGQPRRVCER